MFVLFIYFFVSLSPCSVPGHKPSFQLGENEMELGLGIHGEAGVEKTTVCSANSLISSPFFFLLCFLLPLIIIFSNTIASVS